MPFQPGQVPLKERGLDAPFDFVTLAPLTYSSAGSDLVSVPADFPTDLATVPHLLTWYVPRYGLYTKAAIIHDHQCQVLRPERRFFGDRIFREGLAELQVPWARRWIMWAAVTWATILANLVRRMALTVLSLAAVSFGAGYMIARGSRLGTTLVAVTALGLVPLICMRGSEYPDLHLLILRCYVASIPGAVLLIVCIPLLAVKAITLVIDLIADKERCRLSLSMWIMPLMPVLKVVLRTQALQLFGRPPLPPRLWVALEAGTARERRLRQLLAP